MPDDPATRLALRQVDQAPIDFAIIETELETIDARLPRMPTRGEIRRPALTGMLGGAAPVQMLAFLLR